MSTPVPNLRNLMIPTSELDVAEYCFRVSIDFTHKLRGNEAVEDLKRIITALLNTSGGLIVIQSFVKENVEDATIDSWKRDLEGQLTVFIPPDIYRSCISLTGHDMPLFLVVKKSHKFITLNSYLYVRHMMANNNALHDAESIHQVMRARTSSACHVNPLGSQETFVYGTQINQREGTTVEFKYFNAVRNFAFFSKRMCSERVRKSWFSLANMPTGGDLILGIAEDQASRMNIVYGQVIREKDEENFTLFIRDFLIQNKRECGDTKRRIWGHTDTVPEKDRHWTIRYLPVTDCPNNERRRLIHIHLNHCPGGVFETTPESYMVAEDGLVHAMEFENWTEAIEKSSTDNNHSEQPANNHKSRQRAHTLPTEMPSNQPKYLAWSKNRKEWTRDVLRASIDFDDNVLTFCNEMHVLRATWPLNFTPSRDTVCSSHSRPAEMQHALADIEQRVSRDIEGIAIVSSQWLSNIRHKLPVTRPEHHIMDLLIMNTQSDVHFCSIIAPRSTQADEKPAREYALICARLTKRNLLLCDEHRQTNTSIPQTQVQWHVYKLGSGFIDNQTENMLATNGNVLQDNYRLLKKRLALMLFQKQTYIRASLGHEYGIYLTCQQMEKILMSDFNRFNFIEGPPGSGKTFLALHLCSRYETNKVGYICTTKAFENFLLFQGKCHPILVQTEEDLLNHILSGRFSYFSCIIVDDVHNLLCSDATWLSMFQFIGRNTHMQLFIFADSRYQNFKTEEPMAKLRKQMEKFCNNSFIPYHVKTLSVVHRNTSKIVSFIKCGFEDDQRYAEMSRIYSSHPDEGDDIEIRKMSSYFEEQGSLELVNFVRELINANQVVNGREKSYQATDVAVLVDTEKAEEDAAKLRRTFTHHFPGTRVHDAGTFPVTGLTVDFLDNFHGFDRQVCVFVTSQDIRNSSSTKTRSFNNPMYKAFVASRGISRVIFVVPSLNVELAQKMKLNTLIFQASRLWDTCQDNTITQTTFVEISQGRPTILAINERQQLQMISVNAKELQLSPSVRAITGAVLLASSRHYDQVVVVHQDDSQWRWSVLRIYQENLEVDFQHSLTEEPVTVCWMSDHNVIFVTEKDGGFHAKNYLLDGQLHWTRPLPDITSRQICSVSNCAKIYLAEKGQIHLLDSDGRTVDKIAVQTDSSDLQPLSLCLDNSSDWFLVLCEDGSGRTCMAVLSCKGEHLRKFIQPPEHVTTIANYRDLYMAAGSSGGLILYDIQGIN